ncbi:MAG: hypothetical protein IKJ80_00505 [Clostridia bacterium]|nr:hypothetical protein [Clostridia bacterium]
MKEKTVIAPTVGGTQMNADAPMSDANAAPMAVIGAEQCRKFTEILQKYKAGKAQTESRILASEQWWKLRNAEEEKKETGQGKDGGFTSRSAWLHNVIVSKHADAMDAYPEPNILPREQDDKAEAKMLSSVIPCILEQNSFENTYSDVMWQKLKTGTGVYKVAWSAGKLGGLGDVAVERVNLLNVYWEPGVTDIQASRYFFHTEMLDNDILVEKYPHLDGKLTGSAFTSTRFLTDDAVSTDGKSTVIDVYYRKRVGGAMKLHYVKYVGNEVLYASENDAAYAERGYYDHGKYPYVFDTLYPIEGSPCGYGFVDLCRNPQCSIDLLNTSFIKNAMVGAQPRYFVRGDGKVNEDEFLDLSKPLVHSNGDVSDNYVRRIEHNSLDSIYVNVRDGLVQELRETSGNTETATGSTSSGVTAASAIAALQEASGKGSKDSIRTSYRAYSQIVELCIELVRQFYDIPRKFRILGKYGSDEYVTFSNQGLRARPQSVAGVDLGVALPVFDIKVSAQKKSAYTKVAQNELALQLYGAGFFNPQMVDQALMCLDMMDFDGKDALVGRISQQGTLHQKLMEYMKLALMLTQKFAPEMAEQIGKDVMATMGGARTAGIAPVSIHRGDNIEGLSRKEPGIVENARKRSNEAAQPSENAAVMTESGK